MKKSLLLAVLLSGICMAQTRMIPHLTRSDGGFISQLLITNQGSQNQTINLIAYNETGQSLNTVAVEVPPTQTLVRDPQNLWQDPASLLISGSSDVRVTVSYQNAMGSGSPAHVSEVSDVSSGWHLFGGDWNLVFDGLALVNTGDQPASVRVAQYDYSGQILQEQQINASIPVMGKALYVLGGPGVGSFTYDPSSSFRILADQPLALTALRGDLPIANHLWATEVQPWVNEVNGPDFAIQAVPTDIPAAFANTFDKYMDVFGVRLFATTSVTSRNFSHAGHIMAQYLDNDEDGMPDDPAVVAAMKQRNASMVMFGSENDSQMQVFESQFNQWDTWALQDLRNDETFPNGAASGVFDASLEEVIHLISDNGYAVVYPNVFGTQAGTSIAMAMDLARGGHFTTVPASYPSGAWYTYDDTTCEYNCMITEYFYWALTSILGGQNFPGRLQQIDNEWRLNTRDLVMSGDPAVYQLLTDPQYKIPTRLPDGVYGD